MRRAIPAALLAPLLLPTPALDAAGPDLRIVSAPAVSLRDAPRTVGGPLARLALGTIVTELSRTGGVGTVGGVTAPWLVVSTPAGEEGWLFGALTLPYAEAEKDALALEIADERLRRSGDPFEAVEELHAFLVRAAGSAATPDARARLELATLRALDRAGEAVGFRRRGDPKVVAWAGARAQIPGECEGDVPCSVAWLARSDVRYLERHPHGAHAGEALGNVATAFDAAVEDPRGAALFARSPPGEIDRMRRDLAKVVELLGRIDGPPARAARASAQALLARAEAAGGRR